MSMVPLFAVRPTAPVLSVELELTFGAELGGSTCTPEQLAERVRRHVRFWLCYWSGETEERVRNVVEVKVGGWPRIGVEITARCAGGEALLAAVRAAGGVMDL
jgi:hypothetical protein